MTKTDRKITKRFSWIYLATSILIAYCYFYSVLPNIDLASKTQGMLPWLVIIVVAVLNVLFQSGVFQVEEENYNNLSFAIGLVAFSLVSISQFFLLSYLEFINIMFYYFWLALVFLMFLNSAASSPFLLTAKGSAKAIIRGMTEQDLAIIMLANRSKIKNTKFLEYAHKLGFVGENYKKDFRYSIKLKTDRIRHILIEHTHPEAGQMELVFKKHPNKHFYLDDIII